MEEHSNQETGQQYADRLRALTIPSMQKRIVRNRPSPPAQFCMTYAVDRAALVRAVQEEFLVLGYPADEVSPRTGVFSTRFVDRQVDDQLWMDRYRFTVEPGAGGYEMVRINRQVFISRHQDVYVQGASNGKNETWLLNRILVRTR